MTTDVRTLDVYRYADLQYDKIEVALVDFDADGLLAYALAKRIDPKGKQFPGMLSAKVIFEPNKVKIERRYGKLLDARKAIAFDTTGHRPFDHHPPSKFPGECAFKNVAIVTGLYEKDPIIQAMADQAALWDTKGGGSGSEQIWGRLNADCQDYLCGDDWFTNNRFRQRAVKEMVTEAEKLLERWYQRQRWLLDETIAKLLEEGAIEADDGSCRATVVKGSWLPRLRNIAQYKGFAICVQILPDGRVWIRGNKKLRRTGINTDPMIDDMVRILRSGVAALKELRYDDPDALTADGPVEGSEEIYYAAEGNEIFIGGGPRQEEPLPEWDDLTRDSLINNALLLGLNQKRLPKKCPGYNGLPGCIQAECPFSAAMLPRCQKRGLQV